MHVSPAPVEARLLRRRQFSPAQVLVVSFGALIVLGAVLLRLPLAAAGEPLSFLDALFTRPPLSASPARSWSIRRRI
jgi:hypothetical protein